MGWRTTIRARTKAEADAWLAANAGLLQIGEVHATRPGAFHAGPLAFVGGVREVYTHSAGIRQIAAEVDLVVVAGIIEQDESTAQVDAAVDSLVEWFSTRPHYIDANTVAEPIATTSTELAVGDAAYTAVVITIGRILVAEGRDT